MKPKLKFTSQIVFVLILTLTGCDLYNTKATKEEDKAAKNFQADYDKSVIYVYRSSSPVAIIQAFRIYLDGKALVNCTDGTFIRLVTDPGIHEIGVGNVSNNSLLESVKVVATKGNIYCTELTIGANAASGIPKLKVVDLPTAKEDIKKCTLLKLELK